MLKAVLRCALGPPVRAYRRFAGFLLANAWVDAGPFEIRSELIRIRRQLIALQSSQSDERVEFAPANSDSTSNSLDDLPVGTESSLSQKVDALQRRLDSYPASDLAGISEKLELLHIKFDHAAPSDFGNVSEKMDMLHVKVDQMRSDILYSLTEKIDTLLHLRRSMERIEAHITADVDRLDGHLRYHIDLMRNELARLVVGQERSTHSVVRASEAIEISTHAPVELQTNIKALREEFTGLLAGQEVIKEATRRLADAINGAVVQVANALALGEHSATAADQIAAKLGDLLPASDQLILAGQTLDGAAERLLDNDRKRNTLYVGPSLDAVIDLGGFDVVVPSSEVGLLTYFTRHALAEFEPAVRSALRHYLKPGMVAVDCGVNIGLHSLVMAAAVGAEGKVIGFEAHPILAGAASRSLLLNGFGPRSRVVQAALADDVGQVEFYVASHSPISSLFLPTDGDALPVTVRRTTLDIELAPGSRVDLIKFDIEGAEPLAWRGMTRLIAENQNLVVVMEWSASHFNRSGEDSKLFMNEIVAAGFSAWLLREDFPDEPLPLDMSKVSELEGTNLLFTR